MIIKSRIMNLFVLTALCIITITTNVISQAKGDFVIITDYQNKIYGGTITQNYGRYLLILDTEGSEIEFYNDEIKKIEVSKPYTYDYLQSRLDSKYRQYFFLPSAIGLQKQQYEYRNIGLLYNQLSAGITDYLMVSVAGMPEIFDLEPSLGISLTVHSKVSKRSYLSFTSVVLSEFDYDDFSPERQKDYLHYAKFTYGYPRSNLTFGLALNDRNNAIGTFCWKTPITENLFIFNENSYFLEEGDFYSNLGLSYHFRKIVLNISTIYDSEYSGFYPMFGASVMFGRR